MKSVETKLGSQSDNAVVLKYRKNSVEMRDNLNGKILQDDSGRNSHNSKFEFLWQHGLVACPKANFHVLISNLSDELSYLLIHM